MYLFRLHWGQRTLAKGAKQEQEAPGRRRPQGPQRDVLSSRLRKDERKLNKNLAFSLVEYYILTLAQEKLTGLSYKFWLK